jgi:hypothetical protein
MPADYDATAERRRKLCDPFGHDAYGVVLQEGEHVAVTTGKVVDDYQDSRGMRGLNSYARSTSLEPRAAQPQLLRRALRRPGGVMCHSARCRGWLLPRIQQCADQKLELRRHVEGGLSR